MSEVAEKFARIPIYRDVLKGDKTIVGYLDLDLSKLPEDPTYSLVLIFSRESEFVVKPTASTLVDDYNLCIALQHRYTKGNVELLSIINKSKVV